jgi:hypothetical protein
VIGLRNRRFSKNVRSQTVFYVPSGSVANSATGPGGTIGDSFNWFWKPSVFKPKVSEEIGCVLRRVKIEFVSKQQKEDDDRTRGRVSKLPVGIRFNLYRTTVVGVDRKRGSETDVV